MTVTKLPTAGMAEVTGCSSRCFACPPSCRLRSPLIHNGYEASPGRGQICGDEPGWQGSETHVKLMELKDKTMLSREEAAARLHAIADELASGNDVVIERETMRFVAHVPDQVNLKVEFEVEDDGTELEIELTW
jgi:amphi-Trp domain-containing protein